MRRTSKPIQEIDTLVVGDSMIKDINPILGKEIQRKTQGPRIIISSIISRNDKSVGSKTADTNNELRSMCVQMKWRFLNSDRLNESCLNGSKLHLNNKAQLIQQLSSTLEVSMRPEMQEGPRT